MVLCGAGPSRTDRIGNYFMLLCMFSIVCSFTDCISATLNLPLFVGRVRVACLMM